jgi:hypothetical protein
MSHLASAWFSRRWILVVFNRKMIYSSLKTAPIIDFNATSKLGILVTDVMQRILSEIF